MSDLRVFSARAAIPGPGSSITIELFDTYIIVMGTKKISTGQPPAALHHRHRKQRKEVYRTQSRLFHDIGEVKGRLGHLD
jgi:hypothetical protein